MQVEAELAQFHPRQEMLLTIGVFDGVHLGHRYLVGKLVTEAKRRGLLSGVITFNPHPREVLSLRSRLPHLTTLEERTRLLKEEGVVAVITLSFTADLARLTAGEFMALLQKHLRMRGLVIGPDFALGKDRAGTATVLSRLGEEMGFTVTVVPPKKMGMEVVSSTAIRNALAGGDMPRAARLLGRPFSLQGKVTTGAHRGTILGFPTANLEVNSRQALPPDGVYATRAHFDGRVYPAMTNIGRRPTFGDKNERTVESFILDYREDLYGKDLKIELIERLREEKKFASVEELKRQISEDVKRGREILGVRSQN